MRLLHRTTISHIASVFIWLVVGWRASWARALETNVVFSAYWSNGHTPTAWNQPSSSGIRLCPSHCTGWRGEKARGQGQTGDWGKVRDIVEAIAANASIHLFRMCSTEGKLGGYTLGIWSRVSHVLMQVWMDVYNSRICQQGHWYCCWAQQ